MTGFELMTKKVTRGFNTWWAENEENENIFQLPTLFSMENDAVDDYLDAVLDTMEENGDSIKITEDVREWVIRRMPQDLPKNDSIIKYWAVMLVCQNLAQEMVDNW